jgi:hypothetical protein
MRFRAMAAVRLKCALGHETALLVIAKIKLIWAFSKYIRFAFSWRSRLGFALPSYLFQLIWSGRDPISSVPGEQLGSDRPIRISSRVLFGAPSPRLSQTLVQLSKENYFWPQELIQVHANCASIGSVPD